MRELRSSKRGVWLLILLLSTPSTFLLYGEPFFAHQKLGWTSGQIALSQAFTGLCIALGAYAGGQIAHHIQPRLAITIGIIGCIFGTLSGLESSLLGATGALLAAITLVSSGQAVVWPALEATLMSNEPPFRIRRYVSYYNLTWSLGTATAFLIATPTLTAFGLNALFLLPCCFYVLGLLLLGFVIPASLHSLTPVILPEDDAAHPPLTAAQRAAFRWLGWLANPLGYVAINVVVTYNPSIQTRLGLNLAEASVWCSLWLYVRILTFDVLRRWTWWHYRWRFLCLIFGAAMLSFAAIVLAPNLPVLLLAQLVFGFSVGLLYQSSLLYSMQGSEAQGAHGGFHEAFIGVGIMLGPLIAFGGERLTPGSAAFPITMVLALMAAGLATLIVIGRRASRPLLYRAQSS